VMVGDRASSLTDMQRKAIEFNQRYEAGEIAKPKYSLVDTEKEELGRAMTPEEFARKFPDKAKGFGIKASQSPQTETLFPKYEPKRLSKEPKTQVLQNFQVGQEVVSTGSKGFQYRVTDVKDGQVTFENYQGESKTFPVEFASKGVVPVDYRQPLILGGYLDKSQMTSKEAIAPLPKDAFPVPAKQVYFQPASKVSPNERYLQNKGYKVEYNDPISGVMDLKPPDKLSVNGKTLNFNEYRAKSTEWRRNALAATEPLRSLDYQIPLADKKTRTALEQALFEANQSLPPAPVKADFIVDAPLQKVKEFLSRGSKPYVPESMSNADSLKQAMSQAEALGDVESQMNISKQLEKVQSKRVVKKASGGGFGKAKQAIAQTVQNAAEVVLDAVYQPSKSQPKQSNFIAESTVEAAAKSSGATTAQVKAQIASQRASGNAPDLNVATEAIKQKRSLQGVTLPDPVMQLSGLTESKSFNNEVGKQAAFERSNLAFEQNIPKTRSLKQLQQPIAKSVPSNALQAFEGTNAAFTKNTAKPKAAIASDVPISAPVTVPSQSNLQKAKKFGGQAGDIAIRGFNIGTDVQQGAETFNAAVQRGESGGLALTRAGTSVGSAYGVTALVNALPLPAPLKLIGTLGGSLLAAAGADKAIDLAVGRDEAKEQKYAKDLSKIGLAADTDSELLQPFGKASDAQNYKVAGLTMNNQAFGNSLANVATLGVSSWAPALGRSLAELTNKGSIENARYQSERETSIKAGMDAKSKRSIAYEDRGNGVTAAYGRDRGYTATESRVLALQNLANESGYETARTGKFNSKTLDALEKLGYSQQQITEYIQGKTKAIGAPRAIKTNQEQAKEQFALRSKLGKPQVTSQQLSQALSDERKAQGLKGGQMLNQGQIDQVFSSLAGRSLTSLRNSVKVGGAMTQSSLRLGAGIK
jgi:hypothetical protein